MEIAICRALLEAPVGDAGTHGYLIAKRIQDATGAKRLTAHGTLYKALGRLVRTGLLDSTWEDPTDAAAESRPRRRYYRLSARGAEVARQPDGFIPELLPQPQEANS